MLACPRRPPVSTLGSRRCDVVDHCGDGGSVPGADGCPRVAMLLDHVADGREPVADGARLPRGDKLGTGGADFFRGGGGLSRRNGVHVGSRCWRNWSVCLEKMDRLERDLSRTFYIEEDRPSMLLRSTAYTVRIGVGKPYRTCVNFRRPFFS